MSCDPLATTADLHAPLTMAQLAALEQVRRFLMAVSTPPLALLAVRAGYDRVEHQQGWGLWLRAAGVARPFEHRLPVSVGARAALAQAGCLHRFQRRWRPMVLDGIRAHLPPDAAPLISAPFSREAPWSPPEVIEALGCLEALLESDGPGVGRLARALGRGGLTLTRIRWMRRALSPSEAGAHMVSELGEIQSQLQAFSLLASWHAGWVSALSTYPPGQS